MPIDAKKFVFAQASLCKTSLFILLTLAIGLSWILSDAYGYDINRSIYYNIFGNYLPFVFWAILIAALIYYTNVLLNRHKYLEASGNFLYISGVKLCDIREVNNIAIIKKFNGIRYVKIYTAKKTYVISSMISKTELETVEKSLSDYIISKSLELP